MNRKKQTTYTQYKFYNINPLSNCPDMQPEKPEQIPKLKTDSHSHTYYLE